MTGAHQSLPDLQSVISWHSNVADQVCDRVHSGAIPQEALHCWATVLLVLTRSSSLAKAIRLLLEHDFPEAAGILLRSLCEGGAVLGYICSRGQQAEAFAELYLKSDIIERLHARKRFQSGGITSQYESESSVCELETQEQEFLHIRERLWPGKRSEGRPKYENESTWNGLSIATTFRKACHCAQYDLVYAQLSMLAHAGTYSATYAFRSGLKLPDSLDPGLLPGLVRDHSVIALLWELKHAESLLEITLPEQVRNITDGIDAWPQGCADLP